MRHFAFRFLSKFLLICQMSRPCFTPDWSFFMNARIDKLPSVVIDFNNGPSSALAFSNKVMNASFSAITGDVVSVWECIRPAQSPKIKPGEVLEIYILQHWTSPLKNCKWWVAIVASVSEHSCPLRFVSMSEYLSYTSFMRTNCLSRPITVIKCILTVSNRVYVQYLALCPGES